MKERFSRAFTMHPSNIVTVVFYYTVLVLVVKSEESSTNTNTTLITNNATINNISVSNGNSSNTAEKSRENNVIVERIVHPIMERPLQKEEAKKFPNFKPSPLLKTKFELDRYPLPAFPEAKFAFNGNKERKSWLEKNSQELEWNHISVNNQIKFPQVIKSGAQTTDHPYPFVKSYNYNNDNYNNYNNLLYNDNTINNKKQDENIGLQPPIFGYLNHGENYSPQMFSQIEKYEANDEGRYRPDYTDLEVQDTPNGLESAFPWRKIVKFLTTFVPIGILLSALIPNVISITPINTTQSRARAEEPDAIEHEAKTKMQLVYSSKLARDFKKKGCDHRILCELLLGAGYSRNPEENAEHLLETYVEKEQEITEKTEELKRIMVAVSNGNCEQFRCKAFKES